MKKPATIKASPVKTTATKSPAPVVVTPAKPKRIRIRSKKALAALEEAKNQSVSQTKPVTNAVNAANFSVVFRDLPGTTDPDVLARIGDGIRSINIPGLNRQKSTNFIDDLAIVFVETKDFVAQRFFNWLNRYAKDLIRLTINLLDEDGSVIRSAELVEVQIESVSSMHLDCSVSQHLPMFVVKCKVGGMRWVTP